MSGGFLLNGLGLNINEDDKNVDEGARAGASAAMVNVIWNDATVASVQDAIKDKHAISVAARKAATEYFHTVWGVKMEWRRDFINAYIIGYNAVLEVWLEQ